MLLYRTTCLEPASGHCSDTGYIVRHIRRRYITARIACGEYSGNVILLSAFHCHKQTLASCHALDNLCVININSPSSKYNAKLQLAVHERKSPSWYRASGAARFIIVLQQDRRSRSPTPHHIIAYCLEHVPANSLRRCHPDWVSSRAAVYRRNIRISWHSADCRNTDRRWRRVMPVSYTHLTLPTNREV